MRKFGYTTAGTPRYFCSSCKISSTIHRPDTRQRHIRDRFVSWLIGKQTKSEIAHDAGLTRRALTKQFHSLFNEKWQSPLPKKRSRILIIDGTYIHGNELCTLVAIDEEDRIFWEFEKRETCLTWTSFLSQFKKPDVVVADGQKGLYSALQTLWGDIPFQRCQFHVVALAIHILSRKPKHEAGQTVLHLLYQLKEAKTHEHRDVWILRFRLWEKQWEKVLGEKAPSGTSSRTYRYQKIRRVRGMIRNALPHLFTFLEHVGCPNTTNLVEGWINTEISRGVCRHRGLRVWQKKTLVSVILSHLTREKTTRKFP
jgi:hypothetical protein